MSLSGSKKHLNHFLVYQGKIFCTCLHDTHDPNKIFLVERLPEWTYNYGGLKVILLASCTAFGVNKYRHWAQRWINIESTLIQRMTLNQRRFDCLGAVCSNEFEFWIWKIWQLTRTQYCNIVPTHCCGSKCSPISAHVCVCMCLCRYIMYSPSLKEMS